MEKRKWTDIKSREPEIQAMRAAGKTRQEIADALGLTKVQIKNWINRCNRAQTKEATGLPKRRGRKPAVTLQEYKYENKRLQMENELLRDFLRAFGRR